jgi:hypothetical protein
MEQYATEAEPELSISSYRDAAPQRRCSSRRRLTASMPVSVVLAVDPGLVRDGVKTFLEWRSEFGVAGEFENSADPVKLWRKSQPDMFWMDIGLLGIDNIEATSERMRHSPGIKAIRLSCTTARIR